MNASTKRTRTVLAIAAVTTSAAMLAACGSSSSSSTESGSSSAPAAAGSLAAVCPSTIKIQTSWYPESEKGVVYQIVGPDGKADTNKGAYSGTVEGVTVEVLAGGPYLGNQSTMAKMYQDSSILLGEVSTDDAIAVSNKNPVKAVVAVLQKSPKGVVFDPATYQFKTIEDVGKSGATILKAGQDASTDLLVASGAVKASQFDYSYDGSPARFITAGGKDVMVEYATETPYLYENSFKQWGKPLQSILLADGGYTAYENALSVTPENEKKYGECLKKFVPIVQKAVVAYAADPKPVDDALIKYSQALKSPTVLSTGLNEFTNETMKDKGILANGSDGVAGSFDTDRVTKLVTSMQTVAKNQKITLKDGLTAGDLVTDQYLDTSIKIAG